jgi:hypothetical protein
MIAERVILVINIVVLFACLGMQVCALVHCALQRNDAFNAIGTLSKGLWLALIGGTMLLAVVLISLGPTFTLISVTAALVYWLDVRPAIRDITSGGGNW